MTDDLGPFEELFAEPLRNGLTRPKRVRGAGTKMVNMGELFAFPRISHVPMDRVPMTSQEEAKSLLQSGDLLFARQSLVLSGAGQCSIFIGDSEPVTFESHLIRCRLDESKAVPLFYFYFFQSRLGRAVMESIVEQVAAAGIRGSDLAKLPVPVPSVARQREVVEMLGAFDDKIELNRKMNETLEEMARALFKSWFVDFDPVHAKAAGKKPYGMDDDTAALFPDSFEDSELGPIPKGWVATCLRDVTSKIGSGATPRGGDKAYVDHGITLIRSQNVYDSSFVWSGLARISDRDAEKLRGVTVCADDVLLNITGASILRTCVVPVAVLPARVNQHVAIVRAQPGMPARYLHLHLLRNATKAYLLGMDAGASRQAVTKGHIESVPLVRPDDDVLRRFQEVTEPLFAAVENNSNESHTLAQLRDLLLPKLLSGALSLSRTERAIDAMI